MLICSLGNPSTVSSAARRTPLGALSVAAIALSTAAALLAPGRAEANGPYIISRPPVELSDVLLVQKGAGQFDGKWTVTTSSQTCSSKSATMYLTVVNGAVSGDPYPLTGSIAASGAARWTMSALSDGTPLNFSGTFRGNAGSGAYARADRKCSGRFTARRG
jgi:hypothetical protein